MDGRESEVKDCLQQSKILYCFTKLCLQLTSKYLTSLDFKRSILADTGHPNTWTIQKPDKFVW
jgi:hypothetical protein